MFFLDDMGLLLSSLDEVGILLSSMDEVGILLSSMVEVGLLMPAELGVLFGESRPSELGDKIS